MLQAEARLAARRQARAEAREIRMRELERQQKEIEENADSVYDMYRGKETARNCINKRKILNSQCICSLKRMPCDEKSVITHLHITANNSHVTLSI
jgi:hypothetical protein